MGLGLRRASDILTVTELVARIAGTLESRIGAVWVAGELSDVKKAPSGHLYVTLKDKQAQVQAVMWRSAAQALVFRPADGLEVVAFGRLGLYPRRGSLQLMIEHLEPKGLGALRLAFEQLRARLDADGLFDPARKRPLPRVPRAIGIVTALQGAVLRDMLRVLRERWPAARVVVRPTRVQGQGAGFEIAAGIHALQALGGLDVLIVGRGGGSLEDLWAFNEEIVARAIAASRIPIVSAVGHEVDVTIADYVADVRAATPTAAAAMVVPDRREIAGHVAHCAERLRSGLRRQVHVTEARVTGLARRLGDPRRRVALVGQRIDELADRARRALRRRVVWDHRELARLGAELGRHEPRMVLAALRARLGDAESRLGRAVMRRLDGGRAAFGREHARLEAFSPLACLERGYAIVRRGDSGGEVVRDATTLGPGEPVTLVLARGRARAHIDSTEE